MDSITIFVAEITSHDAIYILENNDELAWFDSKHLFDNNEPIPIACFWSSKSLAEKNKTDQWINHKIIKISVAEFLEDYLVTLINNGFIAGIDFDENLVGFECDPLLLLLDITTVLKQKNIQCEFEYFKSIDDLASQAKKLL